MNLLDEALRDSLTKREKGVGKESDLYRSTDRKILSNSMVGNIKVMREYPTNLTDKQWKSMKNLFEPRERHRKKSSPRDFVYPTVHNKNGVPMANAPQRFHSVANSLLSFSKLEIRRSL